jgi:hypothetical protein
VAFLYLGMISLADVLLLCALYRFCVAVHFSHVPLWIKRLTTVRMSEPAIHDRLLHNLKLNLVVAIRFDIPVTWVKFPVKY